MERQLRNRMHTFQGECKSRNMLERIGAAISSLSVAEQRVGKLLLMDPGSFVVLPVSELACRAKVSSPTVVRFCRSTGYDGLADFKRKLGGSVREGVPFIHPSVDADDKTADILIKVLDNTVAALSTYRAKANVAMMDRVSEAIVAASEAGRRIEIYGVGASGLVAEDAQHKFSLIGVKTMACRDAHFQTAYATMLRGGDCLVCISNSGRTRELLEIADIARSNGATVIAITASGSPLAVIGNFHLSADHSEHYEFYLPMVSRLLHLLIIDVLTTSMALRIGCNKLQPMLREATHKLSNKRYG